MMLQTADFLAGLRVEGIKIHLLYVLKGTPIAELFQNCAFRCLEQEEYVDLVVRFLERLPPDTIVQRLTGDPVPGELLAPQWAKEKSRTLNLIRRLLETSDTWQGRLYQNTLQRKPR
jgi:radical SAM superfamily enzyme